MLTLNQLTAGVQLRTTVPDVGLWNENAYLQRWGAQWPGVVTDPQSTSALPPMTTPGELLVPALATGTVVTVSDLLYQMTADGKGYQCIRATLKPAGGGEERTGFLYTTHGGADQVELYQAPQPDPQPDPQPEPQPDPQPDPQPPDAPPVDPPQPPDIPPNVPGTTVTVTIEAGKITFGQAKYVAAMLSDYTEHLDPLPTGGGGSGANGGGGGSSNGGGGASGGGGNGAGEGTTPSGDGSGPGTGEETKGPLPPSDQEGTPRSAGDLLGAGAPSAIISPDMVVSYHRGGTAPARALQSRLLGDNDPRFILPTEGTKPNDSWSLGKFGWVILGFEKPFLPWPENQMVFQETGGVDAWLDVYAAITINDEQPTRVSATYEMVATIPDPVTGVQRPCRTSLPLNAKAYVATGIEQVPQYFNADPVSGAGTNWRYVGTAIRAAQNQEFGLSLAALPFAPYHFLLLHDVGSESPDSSKYPGADVFNAKFAPVNANGSTYHLLLLDNSQSLKGVSTYAAEIQSYLDYLSALPGNRYVRVARLGSSKNPIEVLPNQLRRYPTDAPAVDWLPAFAAKPELVAGGWIEINKYTTEAERVGTVTAVTEWIQNSMTFDGINSPIAEGVKFLADFAGGAMTATQRSSLFVRIMSDGIHNPDGQIYLPDVAKLPDALSQYFALVDATVIAQLTALNAFVPKLNVQIRSSFDATFPAYQTLRSKYSPFVTVSADSTEGPVTAAPLVSMHTSTHHTDCAAGNKAAKRRIGDKEAKRKMMDGANAIPLPLAWYPTPTDEIDFDTPVVNPS